MASPVAAHSTARKPSITMATQLFIFMGSATSFLDAVRSARLFSRIGRGSNGRSSGRVVRGERKAGKHAR
jgi:hypothetical protein